MKQEVVINEKDSPHSETVLKFVFKILKNMRKTSQIFHYLLFKSLESVKKTRYIPADFRVSSGSGPPKFDFISIKISQSVKMA